VPSHLHRVLALFPERNFTIAQLAARDAAFQTLCEEYDLAAGALEALDAQASLSTADTVRMAEYRALAEELKDDLQQKLSAWPIAKDD
jgi:uncharacterized protein YdcH (DUF465 family)